MKYIILFIISIFLYNSVFSQTREKELGYLDQEFKAGNIPLAEYKKMAKNWRDLLTEIGGYPSLPYDEELQKIKFEHVESYDHSKDIIYKRVKEWAAISFGSIKDVLHYEDYESGKIILKGYFNMVYLQDVKFWFSEKEVINSAKCSQTYVFTIKNNKIKVQVIDLKYEFKYSAYNTIGSYATTSSKDVDSLYPITKSNSTLWKSNLSILKNTELRINSLVNTLDVYMKNYENDYSF